MCLPVVRGPENRHGFASFEEKNNNSFLQFNSFTPPIGLMCLYNPNIPGYTGKVHWSATHPANSNLPSTTPSIIARMHGYIAKHGSSSPYNHQNFSQRVTPVSLHNSCEE
ncbi:LOW QUALITY PROTEIN: protein SPMIP7 [Ara ararauna]